MTDRLMARPGWTPHWEWGGYTLVRPTAGVHLHAGPCGWSACLPTGGAAVARGDAQGYDDAQRRAEAWAEENR